MIDQIARIRFAIGICLVISITYPIQANAWGKRGHAIICQTAAYLTAKHSFKSEFLKDHSFDLAYYCNVPDLVWKKGEMYKKEWFNHFMDLEIFARALKDAHAERPFELTRKEFEKAFPNVPESAGRGYWRIDELMKFIGEVSTSLKKTDLSRDDRHKLQISWLVRAGALGHYVGDLSQPLHVTENYDGQLSDQKGVHAWFEDEALNELFITGGASLEIDVMKAAEKKWKSVNKKWAKKSVIGLLQDLSSDSSMSLNELLKIDKRVGRKNIKKAAHDFRKIIVERMASGTVALASLWRRQVGWDYDGVKFYAFTPEPEFIPSGL